MYKVEFATKVKKKLRYLPKYIVANLLDWIEEVEDKGIQEVRKIPGYHDEPLMGSWKGFRSIRLSRTYRAIYSEHTDIKIISIVEINNHEY